MTKIAETLIEMSSADSGFVAVTADSYWLSSESYNPEGNHEGCNICWRYDQEDRNENEYAESSAYYNLQSK